MIIPLPWAVGAGAGALLLGAFGGWTVRDWKADSDDKAVMEKGDKERDRLTTRANDKSDKLEAALASQQPAQIETRNSIREVYRNVEVPGTCAVPAAAVSLLESARQRANAATTGEHGPSVPDDPPAPDTPDRP